ncbi:MAG: sigma-54 dependent transcriptional regulator [Myxococcota bacterium]
MGGRTTILVVDDEVSVQAALRRTLERVGYEVVTAGTGAQALAVLHERPVDLVLLDLQLPDMSGLVVLARVAELAPAPPVLMVSGAGDIDSAVQAIQRGALDFLQKPVIPERIVVSVQNALRYQRLAQEHAQLAEATLTPPTLLGDSEVMKDLRAMVLRAAQSEARVLISGEHGTGKEVVARLLHHQSRRVAAPFVTLNCAAVPRELIESELFGHVRGAFTGATNTRRGRFELADGGTLFLDEVGEMPVDMQAKLLRVLQEGNFERVGSGEPVPVDVRVVAASNRDLSRAVAAGAFREDLYYRLAVMAIDVPPLRKRLDDVPLLGRSFVLAATKKNYRSAVELLPDAEQALMGYHYPGNVRELQNLIERMVILADGPTIGAAAVQRALPVTRDVESPSDPPGNVNQRFREQVEDAERRILAAALARCDGNVAQAARLLQLERSHLYKKCRALGMPLARVATSSETS